MKSLKGLTVAVSIGDAPDRAKLGFPPREIDRAIMSVCMTMVRAGADILYVGDLRPTGYKFKIFRHLAGAYAAENHVPFKHVVPEPVLRRTSFENLLATLKEKRGTASTLLSIGDKLLPVRSSPAGLLLGRDVDRTTISNQVSYDFWLANLAPSTPAEGYSSARLATVRLADARVSVGGKMGIIDNPDDHYEGAMPGIIEEAILTLEAGKSLIPLAAFGGATRDLSIALGLLDPSARVPRTAQLSTYDASLTVVEGLKSSIPKTILPLMRLVTGEDRIEHVARQVQKLIEHWPS
jgi:hypothetical protein